MCSLVLPSNQTNSPLCITLPTQKMVVGCTYCTVFLRHGTSPVSRTRYLGETRKAASLNQEPHGGYGPIFSLCVHCVIDYFRSETAERLAFGSCESRPSSSSASVTLPVGKTCAVLSAHHRAGRKNGHSRTIEALFRHI